MQVAADPAGNVYILDAGNSRVLKETTTPGGYQESTVTSTAMNSPSAVAVDSTGDVFVVDSGNNRILKETLSAGSYSEAVLPITGLRAPSGVAVDSAGDLFITDTGNKRILKEALVGSNYSQTTRVGGVAAGSIAIDQTGELFIQVIGSGEVQRLTFSGNSYTSYTLASNLSDSVGIAIDSSAAAYIDDGGVGRIYHSPEILVGFGTHQLAGMAIDASRNLYFCDLTSGRVVKLARNGIDFGAVTVGRVSSPVSLIFGFDANTKVAATSVVTQGITGLDYSDAGTGTCATNGSAHNYVVGDNCTVDVLFDPHGPGGRFGAAVLYNATGTPMATGYLKGHGESPLARLIPGAAFPLSLPGVTNPQGLAADAAGNLYIGNSVEQTVDKANAIYKATWTGGGYQVSTIDSNLVYPQCIAVDGVGNVYVVDSNLVHKYSLQHGGGYVKSTIGGNAYTLTVDGAGNLYWVAFNVLHIEGPEGSVSSINFTTPHGTDPDGIAVDSKGDIYLGFGLNGGEILKETPSNGGYVQSTVESNLSVSMLAIDGMDNLYVPDGGIGEISWSSNKLTYLSLDYWGLASGLAFDGSGNAYVSDNLPYSMRLWKIDFSQAAPIHFPATGFGITSASNPASVSLQNAGNAPLTLPIPQTGTNPSLPSGFSVRDSLLSDCPMVSAATSEPATLTPGSSCDFFVSFSRQSASDSSGWMTVVDDSGNALEPGYTMQSIPFAIVGNSLEPIINWPTPAPITYGAPLGLSQTTATANVPGAFTYSPVRGTVLSAGPRTVTATFTPTDQVAFSKVNASVTLVVNRDSPHITWPLPIAITYGTPLTSTQLNASTPVAGTLSYSPTPGTVLSAGAHTLTVTFTPTDTANYASSSATVTLAVSKANPSLSWTSPAAITYGAALSSKQLDATVNIAGTFTYRPAAGTVLKAGVRPLSVTFNPTDFTDFDKASASVNLTVNQVTPVITWAKPAAIVYGTALSATQLNATANVPGAFTYTPAAGTILKAGHQTLNVTFTPTDPTDYAIMTESAGIVVSKAVPAVSWPSPAPIAYGTALSSTQLHASSKLPGTYSYNPAAGTALNAGTHTLWVAFTPSDSTDYVKTGISVVLNVKKAIPDITWLNPTAITYGTPLSAAQLNATANIPGTFAFSPAAGSVLPAGYRTLTVKFTPADSTNYASATKLVALVVSKVKPAVAWPTPAPISYGAALSSVQLNATAAVAGTFKYNPVAGTVLTVGTHTLWVVLTPTDSDNYVNGGASVTLTVNKGQ
jgi:sugar lactone lactonase YvrE